MIGWWFLPDGKENKTLLVLEGSSREGVGELEVRDASVHVFLLA